MNEAEREVAYFSMEIGFHPDIPTYAGGLGMLAGDTLRSAADMRVPMLAVTLLHRHGYFFQRLEGDGIQKEESVRWRVEDYLAPIAGTATVEIEGRTVHIRCWRYDITAADGFMVPIFLLDTDLPENSEWDRHLTDNLYGGDSRYRLCQEVVLGIGGIRMLRALGYDRLQRYHMNEGHAALLTVELLREQREQGGQQDELNSLRRRCVFTTHTPVPAGHDQFELSLVRRILGDPKACGISEAVCHAGRLNMTYLALSLSHYVNGVAKRHGDVSQHMFAEYKIDSITNGVHAANWVCPSMAALYDHHIPGWKQDNFSLRYALSIPNEDIWRAHLTAKDRLVEYLNHETNAGFTTESLLIGLARRATDYKRLDLVFDDAERLKAISRDVGKLQFVFAGKAHPLDEGGKQLIQRIVRIGRSLAPEITVVYLPNYDMQLARLLTSGVDLWLNTPQPPLEASGTSGMKAAMNGVPSLSTLDGWWIEGCLEGLTGWAIGTDGMSYVSQANRHADSESLYTKLERNVVPLFYENRDSWIEIMRHAIALNGSFFNTQRMLQQYVVKAYFE